MNQESNKLRICILPPADLTVESGSTLYTKSIIKELLKRGHEVSVVCSKPDEELQVHSIVTSIPLDHPYDDNQKSDSKIFYESINNTYDALVPFLEINTWDIIHAIYPSYNGIVAGLASSFYNITSVVSSLGRIINLGAYLDIRYRHMAQLSFANATGIITANDEIKDRIINEYGADTHKISVLPMAVSLDGFENTNDLLKSTESSNTIRILSICSCLTPEKGIEDVLYAISQLRKLYTNRQFKYSIVGPDPVKDEPHLEKLKGITRKLRIEDIVEFIGYVPHNRIADYIKENDIFIDARVVGNFSSVILEALSVGVAIISSDVKGNIEFIKDRENGLVFEKGNSDSLLDKLIELVSEDTMKTRLKKSSVDWFGSFGMKYTYVSHIDRLEEIYKQALIKDRS